MTMGMAEPRRISPRPPARRPHLIALNVAHSRGPLLFWIGLALSLAGIIVLAFSYLHPVSAGAWNPLGPFPRQQILNGPKINVESAVRVRATKCYKETVNARSSRFWQSVDVRGTSITDGQFVFSRAKGCATVEFTNPIPSDVRAIVRSGGPQRWIIGGTDTAYRGDGEQSVPHTWQTEPFTLTP